VIVDPLFYAAAIPAILLMGISKTSRACKGIFPEHAVFARLQ
jgi:hypothetical protein